MLVLSKILMIICILLLIILFIVLIVILFPFAYKLDVSYDGNEINARFKYFIFDFSAYVKLKGKIEYYLKHRKTIIIDSNVKKEEKTDDKSQNKKFENKEDLIRKANEANVSAKELFINAKKLEKKIENENNKVDIVKKDDTKLSINVEDFLNKLKNLIPYDMFYVIKSVIGELGSVNNALKPSKYRVDIEYGMSDPYMMGISFAVLSQIVAISDEDISVLPDFKTNSMNIKLYLYRRIILFMLILPILRLLLDSRFRKIVFGKKKGKKA